MSSVVRQQRGSWPPLLHVEQRICYNSDSQESRTLGWESQTPAAVEDVGKSYKTHGRCTTYILVFAAWELYLSNFGLGWISKWEVSRDWFSFKFCLISNDGADIFVDCIRSWLTRSAFKLATFKSTWRCCGHAMDIVNIQYIDNIHGMPSASLFI